jgi:hypothetical protein
MSSRAFLACLALSLLAAACGVKGPPLPPVPDTGPQSDALERPAPSPSPSPSPSPAPRARKKR